MAASKYPPLPQYHELQDRNSWFWDTASPEGLARRQGVPLFGGQTEAPGLSEPDADWAEAMAEEIRARRHPG